MRCECDKLRGQGRAGVWLRQWVAAAALFGWPGMSHAQDEPVRLPPVIPPDSIFSDGQRTTPSMAMIPPSSDQPSFLPYPERLPQRGGPIPSPPAPSFTPPTDPFAEPPAVDD